MNTNDDYKTSKEESLKRLAKIKGVRLEKAPLSFMFKDISSLSKFVTPMNSQIFKLIKRILPGPYALIMKSIKKLPMVIDASSTDISTREEAVDNLVDMDDNTAINFIYWVT